MSYEKCGDDRSASCRIVSAFVHVVITGFCEWPDDLTVTLIRLSVHYAGVALIDDAIYHHKDTVFVFDVNSQNIASSDDL